MKYACSVEIFTMMSGDRDFQLHIPLPLQFCRISIVHQFEIKNFVAETISNQICSKTQHKHNLGGSVWSIAGQRINKTNRKKCVLWLLLVVFNPPLACWGTKWFSYPSQVHLLSVLLTYEIILRLAFAINLFLKILPENVFFLYQLIDIFNLWILELFVFPPVERTCAQLVL